MAWRRWCRRGRRIAGTESGEALFEIGGREGLWKTVERGLGIGLVADFAFVAHPRLATVRVADATVRTEYRLARPIERRYSPKIAAFLQPALGAGPEEPQKAGEPPEAPAGRDRHSPPLPRPARARSRGAGSYPRI